MKECYFYVQINRIIKSCSEEKYTNFRVGKHLSNGYRIRNRLKQEEILQILFQLQFRISFIKVQMRLEEERLN
jgi:hypothetical protein